MYTDMKNRRDFLEKELMAGISAKAIEFSHFVSLRLLIYKQGICLTDTKNILISNKIGML